MRLALLMEQAKLFASAYPDVPAYSRAVSMIENALYSGVSRGVNFVGALDDVILQRVAGYITKATKMQRPASSDGFFGRDTIGTGIHIGDPIIPVQDRLSACLKKAGGNPSKVADCVKKAKIEVILNGGVEKSGHHMLYKNLKSGDNLPGEVITKKVFHQTGVEGLAITGSLDSSLMYEWVETGILKKNAAGNVGVIGSRDTSFILGGRNPANPTVPPTKEDKIGVIDPVTIGLIVSLISAATAGAASILKALRSEKAYAMAEAKGFGTDAFSGNPDDWANGGGGTTSDNSNILLIGGAALAAYLLLDK